MTRDELILEQQKAAEQAAFWKARDAELRGMIWGQDFAEAELGKQHTKELGNGYKLKAKRPISYKLDANTRAALDEIAALGNEGPFIADRLVKWKPELSISEYGKLSEGYKTIIDKVLTTTPGLPVIELVKPDGA
jgi:hypothetical protein